MLLSYRPANKLVFSFFYLLSPPVHFLNYLIYIFSTSDSFVSFLHQKTSYFFLHLEIVVSWEIGWYASRCPEALGWSSRQVTRALTIINLRVFTSVVRQRGEAHLRGRDQSAACWLLMRGRVTLDLSHMIVTCALHKGTSFRYIVIHCSHDSGVLGLFSYRCLEGVVAAIICYAWSRCCEPQA